MSTETNETSKRSSVVTPSMPTQRPLHSASSPRERTRAGDDRSAAGRGLVRSTTSALAISLRDRRVEAVVLLVLVLGERRRGHGGRGVLVDGLLVDGEDFRAGVAVLQVEVAGGFELHGLVVGVVVELGTSTSKSVSSKMSFSPFLTAGGGRGRERRLGFDGLARRAWRLVVWISLVGEGRQLDRIRLAQAQSGRRLEVDPRIAGPRQVDAREVGIGRRDVGVARLAAGSPRTRRWRPARSARSRCPSRAGARRSARSRG